MPPYNLASLVENCDKVVCLADHTNSEGPDLHVKLLRDLMLLVSVKNLHSADPQHDANWAMLRE